MTDLSQGPISADEVAAVRAACARLAQCTSSAEVRSLAERLLADWSEVTRTRFVPAEMGALANLPVGQASEGRFVVLLAVGGQLLGAIVLESTPGQPLARAGGLGLIADYAAATLYHWEVIERQQVALEDQQRMNRTKSDFVSIVSHEFRTPLTGIQGFSEMMVEEDLSPEEMKEFAGDINKDAKRLNRLITELLDLDRMESGRMKLTLEPVDVNELLSEVATQVRATLTQHTIEFELDADLPRVNADRDKLTQVITNLVNNAVKYSPEGGQILLVTGRKGADLQVSVRDEGMGIPPDQLEQVFERYARVESSSRSVQGTGLGLPIVRQIAQMHGGQAWAESVMGVGSTFHVTLPIAGPPGTLE